MRHGRAPGAAPRGVVVVILYQGEASAVLFGRRAPLFFIAAASFLPDVPTATMLAAASALSVESTPLSWRSKLWLSAVAPTVTPAS